MNAGDTDRLAELQARAQAMGVVLTPAGRNWSVTVQALGVGRNDLIDLAEVGRWLDLGEQRLVQRETRPHD